MLESNPIFIIFFGIVFIAAWITAFISWFRIVIAKDKKTYIKSILMFVLPILAVFALAKVGGLFPEAEFPKEPPPNVPKPSELFSKMPKTQLFLLGAAGVVWIVGGNILTIAHNRRMNKKWWQTLNPFEPPFKDFNGKEWSILILLVVVSMSLGVSAISIETVTQGLPLNKPLQPTANAAD